jgi:hypothetical protein
MAATKQAPLRILNYTTSVAAVKTVMEIQTTLARHGAKSISIEYAPDAPEPAAVSFLITVPPGVDVRFRLPCEVAGVMQAMKDARVLDRRNPTTHARRVAWRIVKDWVEAQLAMVLAKQAVMAQVFMPYAVDENTGSTMYQLFEAAQQKRLAAGKS